MWPRVNGLRTLELGTPGTMRAELNGLVLAGAKTTTTGILADYATDGEALETVGERLALVNDDLASIATVEITSVEVTTFGEVTWAHAEAEGEGDANLEDWRTGHARYWASIGSPVDHDTGVICLAFRVMAAPPETAARPL